MEAEEAVVRKFEGKENCLYDVLNVYHLTTRRTIGISFSLNSDLRPKKRWFCHLLLISETYQHTCSNKSGRWISVLLSLDMGYG